LAALLLLLMPACFKLQVDDFCYFTEELAFEAEETADFPEFHARFFLYIPQELLDYMESRRRWNPKLFLKSIRFTSPNNSNYFFTKINAKVYPPTGSLLPWATVVEYDAPSIHPPTTQTWISANPVNVVDYISTSGTIDTEMTLQTQFIVEELLLSIEICTSGTASGPLAPL